jgi:hypothetical protein
MSSRQEEKERRRQERLEREQAEARKAARGKRLRMVLGGALATIVLAGAIVGIVVASSGDDDSQGPTNASGESASVKLPEQQTSDIKAAAKAAGCELKTVAYEGAGHADKDFTPADYKSNPPTSGAHNPSWYQDGIYEPGTTPKLGELVHTLEHGRINIQYRKGTPKQTVDQLESLYNEMSEGYHLMLYENTTEMPYAVAATAWTQMLGCKEMNDKVFDAIRTFRQRYIDKGPERVP